MSDFGISNVSDEDQVEITDLDPQIDGSSDSVSLVLLRLARKIPLFANTRARITMLAWMVCLLMLLFLVQPGLPDVSRQTSRSSGQSTSSTVDVQLPLTIIGSPTANNVTWVRISNGKAVVVQAVPGRIVWHHCKVQRWFAPPKYTHPTVVICT